MGSVTYDWSPVFSALQGLGQRYQYQKALDAMFPQQVSAPQQNSTPTPTPQLTPPPVQIAPGTIRGIGGSSVQITPFTPQQPALPSMAASPAASQAASNPYAAMLPMLRYADPSVGMPLLMQIAAKQADRQQKIQDAALSPMTADEKKALGFRSGDVVYKDISGNPVVEEKSDVSSPEAEAQVIREHQGEQVLSPQALAQKIQIERASQGPQWAELAEKRREFNLSNPLMMGGNGTTGTPGTLPPGVQATVQSMLDGRMAPPSSMAIKTPYWQQMINLANQQDPNFDQTQWGARAAARKDFTGGGKSYQTLNSGNTAIQHLGRLYDQIPDVAGHQIPLVGNLVNAGENAIAGASGQPGLNAYNDTLGHLAEETTKFYRGTGGSESDVSRNMTNLSPNLSIAQKQAAVANTVHLIYGKLAPMVEQYNKTMGTNFAASHFLSGEAINTMKKMGYDPDTGEKVAAPSAGGNGWSIQLVK